MRQRTHDPHGVKVAAPQGETAPIFAVVSCPRCAKPCLIRATTSPLDMPFVQLRPATTTNGLCEECAAHWWLFTVDGLRWAFADGPGVLTLPAVQRELGRLLAQFHPVLGILDWGRLIAHWNLPWPADWALPTDG